MLIARVIAEPARLSASLDRARAALLAAGLTLEEAGAFDVGDDGVQLTVSGGDAQALKTIVADAFGPADLLVADHLPQPPQLLVSDMDSTMIGQECIDELADYAGLKPQIAAITERAMQGELDFTAALTQRVALLRGLPEQAIADCLAHRITPMPGAQALIAALKAAGCRTVLVTGGFHHFADPVARMLGFDHVVGNRLGVADGVLTGALDGPIVDSAVKRTVLLAEAAQLGSAARTLAMGDGANDIPMLQAATYGLAYHAKPKARAAASGIIDRGDLTSALRLLGMAQGGGAAA